MEKPHGFKAFLLTIGIVVSLVLSFSFTVMIAKNSAIIQIEEEMYKKYVSGGGNLSFDEWSKIYKYNYSVEVSDGKPGENGSQGLPGKDGSQGLPGADGSQGLPGKDGNSLLNGENDPSSEIGKDGDLYINTETYDLFLKENGQWIKKGNIKGEDYTGIPSIKNEMIDKLNTYYSSFVDSDETDSFIFFTDPHFGLSDGTVSSLFAPYIKTIKDYYDVTSTNFVVGGGDWINNSNTPEQAKYLLGYFSSAMNNLFEYVPVMGNHDTNYQGTHALSRNEIKNTMFYKQGTEYYTYKTDSATYYVFDTGLDWYQDMNASRVEQLEWFAGSLLNDNPSHAVLLIHTYYYADHTVAAFSKRLGDLIESFNNKTIFTLTEKNNTQYDYSHATGEIEYALCGHSHFDFNDVFINSTGSSIGVPVIGTANFTIGQTPTFDLVVSDFSNRKILLTRVGTGIDREFIY